MHARRIPISFSAFKIASSPCVGMRSAILATVVSALFLPFGATTCAPAPEPPSQQAVEAAWKRADDATEQVVAAQTEVKHIARLREIDRLRYQADVADLSSQVTVLRSLSVGLSLALLAALIWLAIEIRRRRVLMAVLRNMSAGDEGGDSQFDQSPESVVACS